MNCLQWLLAVCLHTFVCMRHSVAVSGCTYYIWFPLISSVFLSAMQLGCIWAVQPYMGSLAQFLMLYLVTNKPDCVCVCVLTWKGANKHEQEACPF